MPKSSVLRYLGNALLVIGYQIMLWKNFKYGLLIKCIGGIFTIPFAIKLRLWDCLVLELFFTIMEVLKLIRIFT
jgi:hypothetical protein